MNKVIFHNKDVGCFYEQSIASHIRDAKNALKLKLFSEADTHIKQIADRILTVQDLYPKDTKDIATLEELQREVLDMDAVPRFTKDMPPIGIRRIGMNCWANSIFQLLANASGLRSDKLLASYFEKYRQAQLCGNKSTREFDAQVLRSLSRTISQDRAVQEDPAPALTEIISRSGLEYSLVQEVTQQNGSKFRSLDAKGQPIVYKEPMIQLDLRSNDSSFQKLFKGFLSTSTDLKGQSKQLKFQQAPDDLVFQARRFGQNADGSFSKISKDIADIPSRFDLDPSFTVQGEDAHYELTGCIIHQGSSYSDGHYVALVKKPSGWYLVNDDVVTPVSERDARNYLKQGYIFHYQKTERIEEPKLPPSKCQEWTRYYVGGAVKILSSIYQYVIAKPLQASFSYVTPTKKQ